ncbi:hypothetical protein ERJ75_000706000 [Trypanosoma vivax]|uniref:Uncharacterized protein n=1 Tax=Trypanosoma vivax (strain Y486) TaxID=1055687 RepID=G0TU24_TRYVY|nr:hypothetical protein TRVL_00172 [Trypanosoma vivax]KAH8614230.1 hypothetical protein ERJ75_000706000 [Trypanosoma vivax]CCC47458.1 conserved hypothetical protein [Trypanosoma vivax Y486]
MNEVRYFLMNVGPHSVGRSYVDLTPSATHTPGTRILGRHSPELYWRIGNDSRCSRRMMSFTLEETCKDAEKEEVAAPKQCPIGGPRVLLKCLGKNSLSVVRRPSGTKKSTGSSPAVMHSVVTRGKSVVLEVGDRVGILGKVWMQFIAARVSVCPTAEKSSVLRHGTGYKVQSLEKDEVFPLPTICVSRPWSELPSSVRDELVHGAWERQPGTMSCAANAPAPYMSGVLAAENEDHGLRCWQAEKEFEAAASTGMLDADNTSQTSSHDYSDTVKSSVDVRSSRKRSLNTALGELHDNDSQPTTPSGTNRRAKRVAVLGGGGIGDVGLPHVETYNETYDERLNEEVCLLESRVAAKEHRLTLQAPTVLGASQPLPEWNQLEIQEGGNRRSTAVTREELQRPEPSMQKITTPHTANDESQFVYYRH